MVRQRGHGEPHRQLVARLLAPDEHEPTGNGRPPKSPYLFTPQGGSQTQAQPGQRHGGGRVGVVEMRLGTGFHHGL